MDEALPEGGAIDAPEEMSEQAVAHTSEDKVPEASEAAAVKSSAPFPLGKPQGSEDDPAAPEPDEPPEDWLEPLEEDDFEDEADETQSWGQSGSREGSVSGSTAGRGGRGGRRRRSRMVVEEEWDECPSLGEGWKRKEVFRRSGCSSGKSDTYYMSPTGVRVRSRVELAKCLSNSVDLDLFDFKSGQFLSEQPSRKRRRQAKESKQSDQSQEEEHEQEEQLLAEQEQEEVLLAKKKRLPAKRKRAKNFSDVEKKHLRQLVLSFPAAQSSHKGPYKSSDKIKAWADICQHFNQATETPRTLKQLQFLWMKMRVEGGLKSSQRKRLPQGPRGRGSALAKLRRREEKRRKRRTKPSTTTPASDSPYHQQHHHPPPPVAPSSPLHAQPAFPSPGPPLTPAPLCLLHIKQESSDTLISNAYTLADTHTLTLTHTPTHTSTHGQAYHPTSAQVAPGNSPQRPLSNTTSTGQNQEMQPNASTDSSGRGLGGDSWMPPGVLDEVVQNGRVHWCRGRASGEQRWSLCERLELRFHRRRMRFLEQEHELRMRVLHLELSLRQHERDMLLSHTASATNHMPAYPLTASDNAAHPLTAIDTPAHPLTASGDAAHPLTASGDAAHPLTASGDAAHPLTASGNAAHPLTVYDNTAQPVCASDNSAHCQAASGEAVNGQTTNHSTVFSETTKKATAPNKTDNQSRFRRQVANQKADPAHLTSDPQGPAQQLVRQKRTANALLALIAGGRKGQSRRSSQPDSQSEVSQDPSSRPPYPVKLKRRSHRQAGRKGTGSKNHTPLGTKRRGRVKSV